jgi:glutaconate CoA-transferase, subunit A
MKPCALRILLRPDPSPDNLRYCRAMSTQSKVVSLTELAERVPDGASLALGGSFLHRSPFAFVRELVRIERRRLEVIKPSPGYDVDLLCRAGAVAKTRAGIVAMEGWFGLARWFRRAIERGDAVHEEHG